MCLRLVSVRLTSDTKVSHSMRPHLLYYLIASFWDFGKYFSRCVVLRVCLELMKYVSAIVSSYWFNVCESVNWFQLEWSIEDIARMECENESTADDSLHWLFVGGTKIKSPPIPDIDEKRFVWFQSFSTVHEGASWSVERFALSVHNPTC